MHILQLNNKRALVTGGGSGIGYAIAKQLKEAGAEVIILGRTEEKIENAAIAPGWIETPMLKQAVDNDPERKQEIRNGIPNKALGLPSDIGYACVYLASEAGRYINGIFLPVDGGAAIGF